jgi:hypothetical protein
MRETKADLLEADVATARAITAHATKKTPAFTIVVESYHRSIMGRDIAGRIAHGQLNFSRFDDAVKSAARVRASIAAKPNALLRE